MKKRKIRTHFLKQLDTQRKKIREKNPEFTVQKEKKRKLKPISNVCVPNQSFFPRKDVDR